MIEMLDGFIYITSKIKHAPKWRKLAEEGWPLCCSWIFMDLDPEDSNQMSQAWEQMIDDCKRSRILIIYREEGEQLKGGLIEIGAVLGNGGRIFLVGAMPDLIEGNRDFRVPVIQFPDIESALVAAIKEVSTVDST